MMKLERWKLVLVAGGAMLFALWWAYSCPERAPYYTMHEMLTALRVVLVGQIALAALVILK